MVTIIAIDKNKKRHVVESLTSAEYVQEGNSGCATMAREYCLENDLQYSNWSVDTEASANVDNIVVRRFK